MSQPSAEPGSPWTSRRKEAAAFIQGRRPFEPEIGLILGSGLGALAGELTDATIIPYREIPHFPASTVHGHAGELVLGMLEGKRVVAMNGRFHYYEGYSMQQVVFPVWVMRTLGAHTLIATNAAGGVNRSFVPGDLMLIVDHINLMWDNPLRGPNDDELGPRFPDMGAAYPWELIEVALAAARDAGVPIQKGVYAAIQGPYYTTQAESQLYRMLRADAVGMSTIPEVIAATHAGMKTLGISCITDVSRDPKAGPSGLLTHEEVLAVANRTRGKFMTLMKAIVRAL